MQIGFLITARLNSTRLPNKLLLRVFDREIIRWMIDRLKLVEKLDKIVLCTSTNSKDDLLETIAKEENIDFFRGNEEDVLLRLNDATKHFNLDYVANVTADAPLVSMKYIQKVILAFLERRADLVTCFNLPHGAYCYGLKPEALAKACEIKNSKNTEVWGRYFFDTGLFNVIDLDIPRKLQRKNYRLTLDYAEDYVFFKNLFEGIGKEIYKKDIDEIVRFLDKNPEIVKINSFCEDLYKKRWEAQSKITLK